MNRSPMLSLVLYASVCMQLCESSALDFLAGVSVDMINALRADTEGT